MSVKPTDDNDKKPVAGTFRDGTPLLADAQSLRSRAEEDGMLFFKNLLPRDDIMQVRLGIMRILERYGLTDPAYGLLDGMADVDKVNRYAAEELQWNGVGVPFDIYRDIQRLESFHALAHHPALLSMYRVLFGEEAFPHPRNIGRIMLPHRDAKVTPSHQDFLHIQGNSETWTCWIPLGDVPLKLGGLTVLRGSHKSGLLGVTEAPGAGGLETILCGLDYEWLTADYEAGDVLTFNSLTVHKSLPNHVPGAIRISCDFRYQALTPEVKLEAGSLQPHGPYRWEELYEGWERTDLQRYWEQARFQFTPYDESIRWQKEKIC